MNQFSCSIFPKCPGCKLQKQVRNPPIWEDIVLFFQKQTPSFSVELISKEIIAWRSKIKLAVRGTVSQPVIGLFEEGTHDVVKMTNCPLHYPSMNEALELIYKIMPIYCIEPYQEKEGKGRLRYIQMLIDRKSLKIQLSLVFNARALQGNEKLFMEELAKYDFWHSIWVNFLPQETNTILGSNFDLISGQEDFEQEIGGISFSFHPSSFSQAHLSLFEEMLKNIEAMIPEDSVLLELYAGVGCISLSMARKLSKVILVESSARSLDCFQKTLSRLSFEIQEKCTFLHSSVEEITSFEGVDVILVDPPRKGLSVECKKKIFLSKASLLVYVSCGPLSFMRDCKEILENGWSLDQAKGFLLFPGSNQVELVVSFKK